MGLTKKLNPSQILVIGFLAIILTGTGLLMLPFSTPKGISFVDALFTSTSAVCVTGLIVLDTPNEFTTAGQIIIMLLIQFGGLGYMTSATIISLMIGKRIGLGERLIMKEALNVLSLEGVVRFTKAVLLITVLFELTGALLLSLRFSLDYPLGEAFFYGLFHAVSAFNNAGFSTFSENLMKYRGDIIINLVITSLIILGGIGFIVISDVYAFARKRVLKLSFHSKVVLTTTAILIVAGAVIIFLFELGNPLTFGQMTLREQILVSYFASVTPRTAGFNTVDYSTLRLDTLFLTIILMFIGASPGSTGGGVKTSTFAVMIMALWATLRSRRDTVMFRRRISQDVVSRAFLLITLAFILVVVVTFNIIRGEDTKYLSTLFEVTSAFGTVGLSIGDGGVRSLSALFTPFGKIMISLTMFAGRLGPLTVGVALIRKTEERFRYPEGRVILG